MAEAGAKRIRLGMVGGGSGAFIGYVHRIAGQLDGECELVPGTLRITTTERVMKVSGTGGFTDEDVQNIIAAFRKVARR
jgi:hypothetical protein